MQTSVWHLLLRTLQSIRLVAATSGTCQLSAALATEPQYGSDANSTKAVEGWPKGGIVTSTCSNRGCGWSFSHVSPIKKYFAKFGPCAGIQYCNAPPRQRGSHHDAPVALWVRRRCRGRLVGGSPPAAADDEARAAARLVRAHTTPAAVGLRHPGRDTLARPPAAFPSCWRWVLKLPASSKRHRCCHLTSQPARHTRPEGGRAPAAAALKKGTVCTLPAAPALPPPWPAWPHSGASGARWPGGRHSHSPRPYPHFLKVELVGLHLNKRWGRWGGAVSPHRRSECSHAH